MVSGALVFIGGAIASNQTNDETTKFTISLAQSIGIAGVGYGANIYYNGTEQRHFRDAVLMQIDLSELQRDNLARAYTAVALESERTEKRIKAVTYGLISIFNAVSATRTSDENVKLAFWALAGANAALSLSFAF